MQEYAVSFFELPALILLFIICAPLMFLWQLIYEKLSQFKIFRKIEKFSIKILELIFHPITYLIIFVIAILIGIFNKIIK